MNYWQNVMRAIKDADVVLFILDARMPELSRNKDLEIKLKESGKKVFTVFNKIDMISRETLEKLKETYKKDFFLSAPKKLGVVKLRTALIALGEKQETKLQVGIVGYPNVGKSAVVNALSGENK